MREELREKEVLAMYDVRGIQNYIFKSNAAKEIIGASQIVDSILTDAFEDYRANLSEDEKKLYRSKWMDDENGQADLTDVFFTDKTVKMQVLFIGGGNAYLLFRTGDLCEKFNQYIGKYILQNTYSLSLAVAVVQRTDSYKDDYLEINNEMRRVKATMPLNMPVGAFPFAEVDSITGYPVVTKSGDDFLSTEAKLKRKAFPKGVDEQIFDNMVSEKGDNSTLAVVHIDGNRMGDRILQTMKDIDDYKTAVSTMRKLSWDISTLFRKRVDEMKAYMDVISLLINRKLNSNHKYYREIIVAGDDITFVCNAKIAIPAVQYFLENIGKDLEGGNQYHFSACAGIAFFNSHFPFSDAYQVAEACCESAKKKAKDVNRRGSNQEIGNFLDFQICSNISASNLEDYRSRHYMSSRYSFIARPYYVNSSNVPMELNNKNQDADISYLNKYLKYFNSVSRNKVKDLRNVIPMGDNEIKKELSFLKSRGLMMEEEDTKLAKYWYDALELMDWYIDTKTGSSRGGK